MLKLLLKKIVSEKVQILRPKQSNFKLFDNSRLDCFTNNKKMFMYKMVQSKNVKLACGQMYVWMVVKSG
jgi:hypothetical protein